MKRTRTPVLFLLGIWDDSPKQNCRLKNLGQKQKSCWIIVHPTNRIQVWHPLLLHISRKLGFWWGVFHLFSSAKQSPTISRVNGHCYVYLTQNTPCEQLLFWVAECHSRSDHRFSTITLVELLWHHWCAFKLYSEGRKTQRNCKHLLDFQNAGYSF